MTEDTQRRQRTKRIPIPYTARSIIRNVMMLLVATTFLWSCSLFKPTKTTPRPTNAPRSHTSAVGSASVPASAAGVSTPTFEALRSSGENDKLYAAVEPWLGVPYKYGGTTRSGVDCSGFVCAIMSEVYGVTLSHNSAMMLEKDVNVISKRDLREGDLLFFQYSGKVQHVGLYLHDGWFVHATNSKGVMVNGMEETYWKNSFYKCGRSPKAGN